MSIREDVMSTTVTPVLAATAVSGRSVTGRSAVIWVPSAFGRRALRIRTGMFLVTAVLLTGCADGVCFNRFGIAWTEARLAGERDPHLRARVPRERLTTLYASDASDEEKRAGKAAAFAALRASYVSRSVASPARPPGRATASAKSPSALPSARNAVGSSASCSRKICRSQTCSIPIGRC